MRPDHCQRGARRVLAGVLVALWQPAGATALLTLPPGEYELTTQTVLPHLEEALRYAPMGFVKHRLRVADAQ